jgi:hypothetical protein
LVELDEIIRATRWFRKPPIFCGAGTGDVALSKE